MRNQLKSLGRRILTPRGGLIAGLAVILLGNAAVLARVAYNRTGEPEVWTFSEREFSRSWRYYHRRNSENSGITLHLSWQGAPTGSLNDTGYRRLGRNVPVDRSQLEALGYATEYDCGFPSGRRPDRIERRVWVALELDGPAHRRHIAELERHLKEQTDEADTEPSKSEQRRLEVIRKRLDDLEHRSSRLYAVDMALGEGALKQRYGEDGRYLILPAVVMPRYDCKEETSVYIRRLFNTSIHVPKRHRATFERLIERGSRDSTRPFEVTVAYGRLHEPWLQNINPGRGGIDQTSPVGK